MRSKTTIASEAIQNHVTTLDRAVAAPPRDDKQDDRSVIYTQRRYPPRRPSCIIAANDK